MYAKSEKGKVELVDSDTIQLSTIDAATTVSVKAKVIQAIVNGEGVSAKNTGNATDAITFTATDSVDVNNKVVAKSGDIKATTEAADITFGADGSMTAKDGSVVLDASKNIVSANEATAITAKDTVDLTAGGDIGSPLNVSAPNLKLASDGSANVAMKKGGYNANGDLTVDGVNTTIKTGGDLKLAVDGNLSTPNGGIIDVGNNLDLTVGSATPEVNLTLGGSTIKAANKTQDAIAFKLNGGNQYPKVIGSGSSTAVFIDGRLAGGDSAYYSILQSYEAQAALGMTPDIQGAKADEAPAIFRDKNQNVIDVLPNTWDAQLDDEAAVPEEAKGSDVAGKVARR